MRDRLGRLAWCRVTTGPVCSPWRSSEAVSGFAAAVSDPAAMPHAGTNGCSAVHSACRRG